MPYSTVLCRRPAGKVTAVIMVDMVIGKSYAWSLENDTP